jgi:hypothetical protein
MIGNANLLYSFHLQSAENLGSRPHPHQDRHSVSVTEPGARVLQRFDSMCGNSRKSRVFVSSYPGTYASVHHAGYTHSMLVDNITSARSESAVSRAL